MATDFRALCAELLAHAERAQSVAAQDLWFGDEDDGLFAQARAALRAAADQLYDSPSQDYLWEIAAELEDHGQA